MELVAEHISKTVKKRLILDDISLHMESGRIYGFIGRNGSGKTMLFRALSGLMAVDKGAVYFNGKKLREAFAVLPGLGIVLEHAQLYPNLTGFENLSYLAGLRKKIGKEEICQALERVGLDPQDKRSYRKYSLGMKQRLAIAQAVMEQPDVLVLDEPTNALDEEGVDMVRRLVLEEKERGALVLAASHNKEDMRVLADCLYRMEKGRIYRQEGQAE